VRLAEEVEPREHEARRTEQEVELLRPRRQLVAEERERIDVGDPVGSAGHVLARDVLPSRVREDDERLPEEEGDDGEVVAEQAPRGDAEHEPEEGAGDDDDGDRRRRGPVDAVLLRGELRVEIGAEAEEGDVAEVEEARVADDDVEPKREEEVDEREDPVDEEVAAVHPERERGGESGEEHEACRRRHVVERAAGEPREPRVALASFLDLGHPLVDADARAVSGVGRRRYVGDVSAVVRHQWGTRPSGSRACRGGRSAARGGRR
jgi:hypothetical protein